MITNNTNREKEHTYNSEIITEKWNICLLIRNVIQELGTVPGKKK